LGEKPILCQWSGDAHGRGGSSNILRYEDNRVINLIQDIIVHGMGIICYRYFSE
jgi:hypothetical protein